MDFTFQIEDIVKLLLAVAAGGLIGVEREFRDKAAGFRTLIFICAGACLFTILSFNLAPESDPNRIAANIVTGVGFLGAGVILRDGGRVIGLTTAATVWLTAAIGMGIGGGEYLLSGIMVALAMIVLWLLPILEHRIDNAREERKYEVVCQATSGKYEELERTFKECGLRVQNHNLEKIGDRLTCSWSAVGSPRKHQQVVQRFHENKDIQELRC